MRPSARPCFRLADRSLASFLFFRTCVAFSPEFSIVIFPLNVPCATSSARRRKAQLCSHPGCRFDCAAQAPSSNGSSYAPTFFVLSILAISASACGAAALPATLLTARPLYGSLHAYAVGDDNSRPDLTFPRAIYCSRGSSARFTTTCDALPPFTPPYFFSPLLASLLFEPCRRARHAQRSNLTPPPVRRILDPASSKGASGRCGDAIAAAERACKRRSGAFRALSGAPSRAARVLWTQAGSARQPYSVAFNGFDEKCASVCRIIYIPSVLFVPNVQRGDSVRRLATGTLANKKNGKRIAMK